MKKTILYLTTIAIITTICASTQPAMAQSARFNYAENRYLLEEPRMPRRMRVSNSTVRAGSVPKASKLLGLTPNSFAPTIVSVPITAMTPAPHAVPQPQQVYCPAVEDSPQAFGSSAQPARLARRESQQSNTTKRQDVVVKQNAAGTVMPPRRSLRASIPLAKSRMETPTHVSATPEKKVLNYDQRLVAPGSTNPATYSTGINSAAQVKGKILTGK